MNTMVKKLFVFFFLFVGGISSVGAYTSTPVDEALIDAFHEKIEQKVQENGEVFRVIVMDLLINLADKTESDRNSHVFMQLFEKTALASSDPELVIRVEHAKNRADATWVKADLQNIATVLVAHQIDNGTFPSHIDQYDKSLMKISEHPWIMEDLIEAWLTSIPPHPQGLGYYYQSLEKNGLYGNGFLLLGEVQDWNVANYCAMSIEQAREELAHKQYREVSELLEKGGNCGQDHMEKMYYMYLY